MMVSKRTMWMLLGVAAGAGLAAALMPTARPRWRRQLSAPTSSQVDEALEDSFPASDPPSFSQSAAVPGPTS